MRLSVLCTLAFLISVVTLCAQDTATVRAADGFQLPVGPNGTGEGYYIARGYRPNGHLGEDWNGVRGGDTDLGDPVYATANGFVMFARNYHVGWGNVVILRHAYYEGSTLKFVDSLYGHLLEFFVQEGEQVRRGQKIARIGNNFGQYDAHLHFEMRKNLQIGMFRSSFARDFSNYYSPNEFVGQHRTCPNGNRMASIPINTYPPVAPPVIAGPHVDTPVFGPSHAAMTARFTKLLPAAPVAPVPTPTPAPLKIITRVATPMPAPSTPEPRIAKATPPPTAPAPASTPKTIRTSVAAASPTPSPTAKSTKSTATASTTEPAGNTPKTATAAIAKSSTPAPSTKTSKTTAAGATPKPAPSSKITKTAVPATTPAPSAKSSRTASATTPAPSGSGSRKGTVVTTASSPVPSSKNTRTTSTTATTASAARNTAKPSTAVATAPTRAPVAVAVAKEPPTPAPTPTPKPVVVTKANTETTIAADPLLPAPTTKDTPIRRTGSTYKVDRFGDLRSKGY